MSSISPPDGKESSPGLLIKPVSLSLGASSASKGQNNNKTTSFNFQSSARSADATSQTLPRRPHHNLHDDDEPDEGGEPAFESVTGFDTLTGKTISADGVSDEKKPLTIPVTSKNNWRDRPGVIKRPKGKNLLPKEVQALQEAQRNGQVHGNEVETAGPSMSYGLSFAQATTTEQEQGSRTDGDQPMENAAPPAVGEGKKSLTEDEIALRALVQESKGDVERRSDLVIESRRVGEEGEEDLYYGRNNETSSFRADVAARPESATLDQYNAIPVEEFGAALLRGMGWKEGQAVGRGNYGSSDSRPATTPHIPARRPGFLGIGAKDVSGGKAEVEFGAWGKAAMRKGSRKAGEGKDGAQNTEGVYMPVLMRNKKTGETITEEELSSLKKESRKQNNDDWKERRDRNLERNARDRDRDEDWDTRRLEYDEDNRRNGSSRRDRSRSSSDRHSRRQRYGDEDGDGRDDRYYRDRDRERDREHRHGRGRNGARDRDRKSHRYRNDDQYSSRHSSSNASSRHRDRDSDRDSHRRRKYDDR